MEEATKPPRKQRSDPERLGVIKTLQVRCLFPIGDWVQDCAMKATKFVTLDIAGVSFVLTRTLVS